MCLGLRTAGTTHQNAQGVSLGLVAVALVVLSSPACGARPGFPIVAGDDPEATTVVDGGSTTTEATTAATTAASAASTAAIATGDAPPPMLLFEAEDATIASPGEIFDDPDASGGQYVTVPGNGGNPSGGIVFDIDVPQSGSYDIWGRVLTPTTFNNSFELYIDGQAIRDPWHTEADPDWNWLNAATHTFTGGPHVVEIGYREAGSQLDVLAIIDNSMDPDLPFP